MALQFDSTTVHEAVKAHTDFRLNIPNEEKAIPYLPGGTQLTLTIAGQTLNRTVPAGKKASIKIIYQEEDV